MLSQKKLENESMPPLFDWGYSNRENPQPIDFLGVGRHHLVDTGTLREGVVK